MQKFGQMDGIISNARPLPGPCMNGISEPHFPKLKRQGLEVRTCGVLDPRVQELCMHARNVSLGQEAGSFGSVFIPLDPFE